MKIWKALGASGAAIVTATAISAAPAQAAYPTTKFVQMKNSIGGTADITVTWYNRSVLITGKVTDASSDSKGTSICYFGVTGTNGNGQYVGDCTEVYSGSKTFSYNATLSDGLGGNVKLYSVTAQIGVLYADGSSDGQGNQTKNRPS